MKAARLHAPGDIRVAEVAPPRPAEGQELVRVEAVGLCGSDLHWFDEAGIGDARLTAPLVIGHELAGTIEGGPRHGERVAVDPAIPCGICEQCHDGDHNLCPTVEFAGHGSRDGGLRELMAWPGGLLYPLPSALTAADGAMLEPLGVAIHAIDLAHVRVGMTVGVVGCGPIGLLALQVARAAGATTLLAAELHEHRRSAARELGATSVVGGIDEVAQFESTADVVIEVGGTDGAVDASLRMARPGARVVLVGIPNGDQSTFTASRARRKGLSLVLSRRMRDVYPRAITLVERALVDVRSIVSHHYDLDDVAEAFDVARSRAGGKVLVRPTGR